MSVVQGLLSRPPAVPAGGYARIKNTRSPQPQPMPQPMPQPIPQQMPQQMPQQPMPMAWQGPQMMQPQQVRPFSTSVKAR